MTPTERKLAYLNAALSLGDPLLPLPDQAVSVVGLSVSGVREYGRVVRFERLLRPYDSKRPYWYEALVRFRVETGSGSLPKLVWVGLPAPAGTLHFDDLPANSPTFDVWPRGLFATRYLLTRDTL